MTNRVLEANDALAALLETVFPAPAASHFRNPDGARVFGTADFIVSLQDDQEPSVQAVLSGPIYDLMLAPVVTLARKGVEAARRAAPWADVDTLRLALEADPTLGGKVEDARLEAVEGAELDKTRWLAGGLDVSVRLLFAAPSAAG